MKVSIIIPVYNVAPYLEACLSSVMRQTYQDEMECLLVDDCGTDDSISIAERMVTAYHGPIRFALLHHELNRGLSAARNTGLNAATGEYVYFLDSDDEISEGCIEKMVRLVLEDSSIEMVMGNYSIHSEGCEVASFENPIEKQQEVFANCDSVRNYFFDRRGFYVYAWNKLIKKDFLIRNKLYFTEGMKWEDYSWTFLVVKYLNHLLVLPDATYIYYKRTNSITTKADRAEKSHFMGLAYVEIANHFSEEESGREARRYIKKASARVTPIAPRILCSAKQLACLIQSLKRTATQRIA